MAEYKIKITGEYDVIVLSPKMISLLIDKIRGSDTTEMFIPAEEFLPRRYAEYINRVLDANTEIAKTLPNRSAYTLIAEQIKKIQFDERDCFDSVAITEPERNPRFDMEASEDFYIVAKHKNSRFKYVFKNENGRPFQVLCKR